MPPPKEKTAAPAPVPPKESSAVVEATRGGIKFMRLTHLSPNQEFVLLLPTGERLRGMVLRQITELTCTAFEELPDDVILVVHARLVLPQD